jgi:thiamine-monophosphate kinase
MKNKILSDIGELGLIKFIEDLIFENTGKRLIRDDSFFFDLSKKNIITDNTQSILVLNSDMLVSTTDVPPLMDFYQIGRKAVLMNISDLIVKGIQPKGIIISLGLSKDMELLNFKDLILGIIDFCLKWNLDYIGGDINETKELIVNPTVFGFQNHSKIIYRNGLKQGDYLVANGKFGLTGVGFDILLNRNGNLKSFPLYKKSILSVLEPGDLGKEAFILSENNFASTSIDSSDGLAKSLTDLIYSNPSKNFGFEIDFNEEFIDKEALLYSQEFNIPLENLVFNGGEEFIHLFTINPKNYNSAQKAIQTKGGQIFKIGKVISNKIIYFLRNGKKIQLKRFGFEHFY